MATSPPPRQQRKELRVETRERREKRREKEVDVKKREYGRHLRGKSEQGREQKQTRTQKGGMVEKRVGPYEKGKIRAERRNQRGN